MRVEGGDRLQGGPVFWTMLEGSHHTVTSSSCDVSAVSGEAP